MTALEFIEKKDKDNDGPGWTEDIDFLAKAFDEYAAEVNSNQSLQLQKLEAMVKKFQEVIEKIPVVQE